MVHLDEKRPRCALREALLFSGYGLPHWIWAGVDLNLITTGEFTQVYGGVRADVARARLRLWRAATRGLSAKPFLAPKATFNRARRSQCPGSEITLLGVGSGGRRRRASPHSAILVDFILDAHARRARAEAICTKNRIVPSLPIRCTAILRVAAVARVMREGALKFGPLVEHVFATGRDAPITRVGPAGALQLTDHLELNAALTLAVSSPDSLGLSLGAYGVAGLRYRWATGERAPKWPWQGELVP